MSNHPNPVDVVSANIAAAFVDLADQLLGQLQPEQLQGLRVNRALAFAHGRGLIGERSFSKAMKTLSRGAAIGTDPSLELLTDIAVAYRNRKAKLPLELHARLLALLGRAI